MSLRQIIITLIGVGILGYLALFLIQTAPHDPEVWHKDPLTEPSSETPNSFRVAPAGTKVTKVDQEAEIYAASATVISEALDTFILTQPRTVRVAGYPQENFLTYAQRTKNLKFPDYISIKVIELGENRSTIAIYSRARYGYGDMGVNKARVLRWLETLSSFIEEEPPALQAPNEGADEASSDATVETSSDD